MPRISVIIPVFNRPALLADAVESVLRQTYRDFEVIIVDDGSTDETPSVARQFVERADSRVQCLAQANAGPGVARNTGLSAARGELIQFLDSDDWLEPEKFARQVMLLDAHPDRGVCYCTTLRGSSKESATPTARSSQTFDRILPEFLFERGWPTVSPLWRKAVCDQIGRFSAGRVMEDWEFDCRAGLACVRPIHCPEVLAYMRDHAAERAGLGFDEFNTARVVDYFAAHRTIALGVLQSDLVGAAARGQFARKLFFISRFCASRGLSSEAQQASDLALRLMPRGAWAIDQHLVRTLARWLGWKTAVKIVETVRSSVSWAGVRRPASLPTNL
jgi:glycosyltransferase involved in cell wall biosynthesis